MSLYAIGDLHLSLATDKPMDVFGGRWERYVEKLLDGFSALGPEDMTVLCGDLTWGMNLEESLADFQFIHALPGKKLVLKGNHDYWWNTATKIGQFFFAHGIDSIGLLHNNCHFYGDIAICGTRGWFYEEETGSEHDKKIMNRELLRLEASLKAAGDREKFCFLHYPPRYKDYICQEIVDLMTAYGVTRCFYGHIHGPSHRFAVEGLVGGIDYRMVSADALQFAPYKILES
ncbi:MAG: metallophosphoesterase [Oscillospiraceae bacterium]|nr:metallophosphoesterase [Oscillospiraceae bacterium]